jgi:hypothetical protein
MTEDEELTATIATRLDLDHQYVVLVPTWDSQLIDSIRRCGRAAARSLGWKVRTVVAERDDGRVAVCVVIIESTPGEEARISERGELLLQQLFQEGS